MSNGVLHKRAAYEEPQIEEAHIRAATDVRIQQDLVRNGKLGGFFYLISFTGILIVEPRLAESAYVVIPAGVLLLLAALYRFCVAYLAVPGADSFRRMQQGIALSLAVWTLFSCWVIDSIGEINNTLALVLGAHAAFTAGAMLTTVGDRQLQQALVFGMLVPVMISLVVAIRHLDAWTAFVFLASYLVFLWWIGGRQHQEYVDAIRTAARLELLTEVLQEARNEALEASSAKSAFLAQMSHEIRTPLNGVIGSSELLRMTKISPEQQEYIDTINESGQLLMELVNDILDFSKLHSRKLELNERPADVRHMLENLHRMMRPEAERKGLGLQCVIDETLPPRLVVDKLRLQQILVNLLTNALKFTPSGSITMSVTYQPADEETGLLLCEVVDTGIGIDEEHQQKIFEQFFQVESFHSELRGAGLGLSICRQLVDLMEGEMGVNSTPGKGSTFWFSLPVQRGAVSRAVAEPIAPQSATGRHLGFKPTSAACKVLVAEDNEVNRLVVSQYLKRLPCTFLLANDGQQAIDLYESEQPDLILMDCNMPIVDGMDATRRIRARESATGRARTPIVALTAHVTQDIVDRCLEAGMDDHLAKPMLMADMRQMLEKWLTPATERAAAVV